MQEKVMGCDDGVQDKARHMSHAQIGKFYDGWGPIIKFSAGGFQGAASKIADQEDRWTTADRGNLARIAVAAEKTNELLRKITTAKTLKMLGRLADALEAWEKSKNTAPAPAEAS